MISVIFVVVGLALGFSLGYAYLQTKRVDYHAPDSNMIKKQIFTAKNGDKVKLTPIAFVCPPSLSKTTLMAQLKK